MDYVGNVDRFGEIFPEVEQQEEIVVTAYYPETVDIVAVEADLQARCWNLPVCLHRPSCRLPFWRVC